jgi:ATP adenylyltransferase
MSDKYVDLRNARVDEQRAVMNKIVQDGVCPFCMEHLAKYHSKPALREGAHWILTENQWPYEHTKRHFLAITKVHLEHIKDLPAGAMEELGEHFSWAAKEFGIEGGGVVMRFGNSDLAGSTVAHLHAQLIEPDIHSPGYEPVRAKIGRSR